MLDTGLIRRITGRNRCAMGIMRAQRRGELLVERIGRRSRYGRRNEDLNDKRVGDDDAHERPAEPPPSPLAIVLRFCHRPRTLCRDRPSMQERPGAANALHRSMPYCCNQRGSLTPSLPQLSESREQLAKLKDVAFAAGKKPASSSCNSSAAKAQDHLPGLPAMDQADRDAGQVQ